MPEATASDTGRATRATPIRVAVVGGSGYSGRELLRILLRHPLAEIAAVASTTHAGCAVADVVPALADETGLAFVDPGEIAGGGHDAVFFATPEGVASSMCQDMLDAGSVVIDIGPDFRLADEGTWRKWYAAEHKAPHLLAEAVYGLVELNRERVRQARVIGNPGCYPTAVLLALCPLVKGGAILPDPIIADAKSGATGAGRKTGRPDLLFAEVDGNLSAYKVGGHRHHPEMVRMLGEAGADPGSIGLTFVPHLLPVRRGILATLYVRAAGGADLRKALADFYGGEPFVRVLPEGSMPSLASVAGTNLCRLGVHQFADGRGVVVAAIDNLVKGAAGQAVQNLNVRFGLGETAGLDAAPLSP